MKRALFSVPEHQDLISFARALVALGWEIIVTPNLSGLFQKEGIPAVNVTSFVGVENTYPFPPTMHPKIEAALTLERYPPIDLVYDITYSLDVGNDVGGHTLLALAVKGNRIVVHDVADMYRVIEALAQDKDHACIPESLRADLIKRALSKT